MKQLFQDMDKAIRSKEELVCCHVQREIGSLSATSRQHQRRLRVAYLKKRLLQAYLRHRYQFLFLFRDRLEV